MTTLIFLNLEDSSTKPKKRKHAIYTSHDFYLALRKVRLKRKINLNNLQVKAQNRLA